MDFLEFSGRRFEFIRASDIARDGMLLMADEILSDGEQRTVLEALWHDPDGRLTFSAFERDLPFDLVETFLANVKPALTPSNQSGN